MEEREQLSIDVTDHPEEGQLSNIPLQNEGLKESTQNRRVHSEYFAEMDTKLTKSKAGPFALGRVLGKGVTGTVYEGTHMVTNFKVALKVIKKKSFLKTSHRWKSLRREIAIMKLMDHPNVLKLYDVFETQDKIFLVTEYAKGGDLFSYVLQGPLRPEEALRMLAQVIMGIQHCHEHCIVHRDLKLENLLLDDDKNVKIADFGMARMAKAGRTLSTICGSPHYASPEVLKGGKYDGKVSDVWSLGVILFAMATGGLPFDDESMPKLFRRIYRGEFAIPSTVDGNISDLIRKMIVVDCKERIKMEDIQHHRAFNQTEFFLRNLSLSDAQERTREIGAVDEVVFEDLIAILGSSEAHREEVKSRILSVTGTPERVLYLLLSKRKQSRIQQLIQLSPRPSPRGKPTGFSFGSPTLSPAVPSSPSYSSDMEPRTSPPTLERIPSEDPPPLSISALDIGKGEEVSLEKLTATRSSARVLHDSTAPASRESAKVTAFYISGQSERLLPSSFSPSSFANQKKPSFFQPPLAPQIPPSSDRSTSPASATSASAEPSVAPSSSSAPTTRRQSVVTDLPPSSSSSSSSASSSSPFLSSSFSLSSTSTSSPSLSSSMSSPSPPPAPSLSPLPTLPYPVLNSPPLPAVSSVSLSVATYPPAHSLQPSHHQASPPRPLHSNPSLSSSSSIQSTTVLSPSSPSPPPMPFLPATSFSSVSVSSSSLSDGAPASPETTPPSSPFNYTRPSSTSQSRGATSPSMERHFHPGLSGSGVGLVSRYKAPKSPSPTHMNRVSLSPHSARYQHGVHPYESGRISPLPSFPEEGGRLSPHPEIPASGSRRKGSAPLMINSFNLVPQNTKPGPVRKGSFPRNSDSLVTASTPEVTPRDDDLVTPSSAPPSRRASSGTLSKTVGVTSSGAESRETGRETRGPAGGSERDLRRPGSRKGFSKRVDTAFRDDSGTFVGRAFTSDTLKPAYVSYSVPSSPTAPQSPDVPTSPTVTLGPDRAHHWFKDIFIRRPSLDPWRAPPPAPPSHAPPAYTSPEEELSSPYIPHSHSHSRTSALHQHTQQQLPQDPPLYPRAASTNIPARQSRSPTRARKKFTEQRHRMMRYFRMTSPAALQTAPGGGAGGSSSAAPTTSLSPTGLQPPVGPSVPSVAPRALSPTRFRATSPRLTTTTEPSGASSLKSGPPAITTSPQRSAVNSPMHKIRSSGNIRNLQSPDHKLTNS